jgi:hypothetical protein
MQHLAWTWRWSTYKFEILCDCDLLLIFIKSVSYLLRAGQWRNCGSHMKFSCLQSVQISCGTSKASCSISNGDSLCQRTAAVAWSHTPSLHLVARNCGSDKFSCLQSVQIGCGTSTASCSISNGNSAAGAWSRTTSLHLVAILRMSEALSALPYISVWHAEGQFYV